MRINENESCSCHRSVIRYRKRVCSSIGIFYKDLDEIWVIARREERLEQLRKEVNVPLRIFAGDLQKKHVYRQFYTELCQWHPNIRMLVNAAGFGKSGTFSEIAEKENGFIRI